MNLRLHACTRNEVVQHFLIFVLEIISAQTYKFRRQSLETTRKWGRINMLWDYFKKWENGWFVIADNEYKIKTLLSATWLKRKIRDC